MKNTERVSGVRQPFPGLRPFEPDENDIFFGRGEQIDELLARLENHRFVAVVGASGSGKSSLVRAGLLPSLESGFLSGTGTEWRMVLMRPGQAPFARLATALLAATCESETDATAPAFIEATLRSGPRGLAEAIQDADLPAGTNVLVLIDQFEEIFRFRHRGRSYGPTAEGGTDDAEDRNDATAFVNMLLATARGELPVYIVLTMRSDFLGDCDAFHGLPEAINDCQFLVPRLRRDQVRETITGPLHMFEARAEEGLVNRILNEIGSNPDQLPLMQHLLLRMWMRASQMPGEAVLEVSDYLAVGGLENALSQHADEAYSELSDDRTKRVAELMFRSLCDLSADARSTRRLVTLAEVAAVAAVDIETVRAAACVFLRPDRSFLISSPPGDLTPFTTLDISHEALIRQWGRLSEWVTQEARFASWYRRLQESARLREEGRASLLVSPELDVAIWWRDNQKPTAAWAARYGGDFESSMEFLEASVAAQQAEVQRKRREARRKTVIPGSTLAVVSSLMLVAVFLWRRSHSQAAELNDLFAASQLSLGTASAREGRLSDGLLRYWSGYEKTGSNPPARRSVLNLMSSWSALAGRPLMHDSAVRKAVFSRNGETVLTLTDDVAQLWDVSSEYPRWDFKNSESKWDFRKSLQVPGMIRAGDSPWSAIAVQSDGITLLIARDNSAQLWDLSTGEPIGNPLIHEETISLADFSADGSTIVTRGGNHTQLWDKETRSRKGPPHSNKGTRFALSPDGRSFVESKDGVATLTNVSNQLTVEDRDFGTVRLLAFSPDGNIILQVSPDVCRLRDARTLKLRDGTAELKHSGVRTVAFSPDSRVLLTGSNDNAAKLWDTKTGHQIGLPLQHYGTVVTAAFSDDSSTVLTGSADNSAILWEVKTGEALSYPLRHMGTVESVAYSPKGRTFLTGSIGGGARLWKTPGELPVTRDGSGVTWWADGLKPPGQTFDFANCINVQSQEHMEDGTRSEGLLEKQKVAAVSPDGRRKLIVADRLLRLVEVSTPEQDMAVFTHDFPIVAASFGPGGEWILAATRDSVILWDAKDTTAPKREFRHPSRLLAAAMSPDGNLVATGGTDNQAILSNVKTGKPKGKPILHLDDVLAIAFSPDSRLVATGSADDTVKIRIVGEDELDDTSQAHYDAVTDVMFSADGTTLITASDDKSARFWDVFSGEIRGDPLMHSNEVKAARFSRNGRYALTIDDEGRSLLWDVVPPAFDDEERLRLSIECRSGIHVQSELAGERLTQREWLDRRIRLDELGGPCDVRQWDDLSEAEKDELAGRNRKR